MAKIGLKGIRYAVLDTEDDSYGTPATIGKGVKCSVSVKNNDAKLYADDALAESDSTFSSASVTLEIDDDRPAVIGALLGRTVSVDGEIVRTASDIAPYVGLGRIVTKMVDGAYAYKAEFIAKVKFKEPNQEESTKGDAVAFGTVSLEGDASTIATGQWSKTNTFTALADAVEYLDTCFGIVGA